MCEQLLDLGVDPTIKDRFGLTAQQWARKNKHHDIIAMIQYHLDKLNQKPKQH